MFTSSEKLTQDIRDTFKRVYDCETFDSYNGVECCNHISECEHHNLHVVPDVGIVEILNSKGEECKPGEIGEIISTGLLNLNQPLIRYRMGDYVKISEIQNCSCGRNMLIVEEIVGRIMDTVILKDGREMMQFYRVFSGVNAIIESQVIQHSLEEIEIKMFISRELTKGEEDQICERLRSQLGEINFQLNFVVSIPKGPNGKFKSVISHVQRG